MNTAKTVIPALLASCLIALSANAQGLIGERYAQVSLLYEDFDLDGATLDAWGGGLDLNIPLTEREAAFGFDFRGGLNYVSAEESGIDIDVYGVAGGVRGYVPATSTITPYAEAGLGWSRAKVSGFGFSDTDSSFDLPLGLGVEFEAGKFSLTPFFNYVVALDTDEEDVWSVGLGAAYWFTPAVAGSLSVAHTDYDDDVESQGIKAGLILAF